MKPFWALMMAILMMSIASCDNSTPTPSVLAEPAEKTANVGAPYGEEIDIKAIDLFAAYTNKAQTRTWLPLNIYDEPDDQVKTIFAVLDSFELAHPNWEIKSWQIEKQQNAHGTPAIIFGLWIEHRPK